jgi:hypothetical protein
MKPDPLEYHPRPSKPLGVNGAAEGAIIPVGALMPLSPARVWLVEPNSSKIGEVA